MAEQPAGTAEQLYQGILAGKVPRQVRLFAAQGLLPVPREDLLRLQVLLSSDPDPELAQHARTSIENEESATLVEWVKEPEMEPLVLDLVVRIRQEDEIWSAVAVHPKVSDETLRVLARNADQFLQDIIITNQVRLMGCLEILEDLRANPRVSQVILRRVREFEEEFIEKAIRGDIDADDDAPSIEEAIEALRDIGAHIPNEGTMPYSSHEDPAIEEEARRLGLSTYGKLAHMTVKEKIAVALKGTRDERTVLVNSRNRLVVRAVLGSPKLTESEIERFASLRSVSDEVIRVISANRRWMQSYGVVHALAQNPKTPVQTAIRILPRLSVRDLNRLGKNRNINPVVRRRAEEFHSRRRR
jgi:hypothetical protein